MILKRSKTLIFALLVVVFSFTLTGLSNIAYSAPQYANTQFQKFWQYSDKLVDEVPNAGRGFTWGPVSFGTFQEDYKEAPGGKRTVQYFDKSRMELSADGQHVTNGLLTKELVTGKRQDGDSTFTPLQPSHSQVAGDDNTNGGNGIAPVYASFANVVSFNPGENKATSQVGQNAILSIDKSGKVSNLDTPNLPAQIKIGTYEPIFGHNVPQVFLDFQNQTGRVWDDSTSAYITGKVYTDNPTANVFGYPISEAYWAYVIVAGVQQPVLIQLFERRVLTYTPNNADPFKVEMGNIGQHYYKWRTTPQVLPPAPVTSCAATPKSINAFEILKCGPAGMVMAAFTQMQANEDVTVTVLRPDGSTARTFTRKAAADGGVDGAYGSFPNSPLGEWTIAFKGTISGKEAKSFIWLDPSVSAPTIYVTPNPGKIDEPVFFTAVGFKPGEQVRPNIRTPQNNSADFSGNFTTSQGGGVTFYVIPTQDFTPRDYIVPGHWFLSLASVQDGSRFATVYFDLK